MWFRRKHKDEAIEMIKDLRNRALQVTAAELNLTPSEQRRHVWGILMEIGFPEGVATLAAFADGSTSLYYSNGGGVIGAGGHAVVRAASDALMSTAEMHVAEFAATGATPLPAVGRVRFYVRTFNGLLTAEAHEAALGDGEHALSPVFHAGHEVIATVRETSAQRHS